MKKTCKSKDEFTENDAWNFYYKDMDDYDYEEEIEREDEERYNDCTCGSYTKDGLKVADCICGNT